MKKINYIYILTFFSIISIERITAQNPIRLLRYDDDFTYIKNDSLKKGYENLKRIPFRKAGYISFGGELREQFQKYKNINFGDIPPTYKNISTNQLYHRLMVHSNIEIGERLRFFVQLNNTLRFFNANPKVPEIDENQLSIHQVFAEIKYKQWKFRVGRQEMFYGNHRLITVREGPNTRKAFDGIVIKRKSKTGNIDLFATSPTISKQYILDDESFKEGLVGIYGVQRFFEGKIGLDYFVVNLQSKLRKYNNQSGEENRQTYGTRLYSHFKKLNFEAEGAYQSGKFADLVIDAYSFLGDVNFTFLPSKKGVLGFTTNATSGDVDGKDNKLNTYNLLYAKPAYGLAIPIGSTNILSLSLYLKINPFPKLNILTQVFFLARNSIQDGLYSPGMTQNRPKAISKFTPEKTLGEFYLLEMVYQKSNNISFALDASFFKAGPYPKVTGNGKDITYLSFKSTFKF